MAKVVVTTLHDWRKIAEMAGGDPLLIMFDTSLSELEVPDVTQAALDAAFATYTGDQVNIDEATAAAFLADHRNRATKRADVNIFDRALVSELLFEINKLNTRMQEVHDAMAAMKATTGGTQNLRDGIPASFLGISPKLRSQILQGIIDRIGAGEGDP